MKRKSIRSILAMVLLAGMISLAGCASAPQNYMMTGAGIGGAAGAAIGAAANGKNPWKGAAIGGLLGGATGAIGGEVYRRTQQPAQPQQGYYQYGPQPGYGYDYGAYQGSGNSPYQYGY